MRLHLQDLWLWVLDLKGIVCTLSMGWAGSIASFPVAFFSGSWPEPCGWALISRESPIALRELECVPARNSAWPDFSRIHPSIDLLFGSTWVYNKDYSLPYFSLVFTLTKQARRAGCVHVLWHGLQLLSFSMSLFYPVLFCASMANCGLEWYSEMCQHLPWKFDKTQLHAYHFSISKNGVIELEVNIH